MSAGVLATGKSFAVALLTPLSVDCADSTTATSNSNGVVWSSSDFGCGFRALRRSKIVRRFAGFMGPWRPAWRARGRSRRGGAGVGLARLEVPVSSFSASRPVPPTAAPPAHHPARERDLREFLEHIAVRLADPFVLVRKPALGRFGLVEPAERSLRPRNHPVRDAQHAGVAARLPCREGLLEIARAVAASPCSR